MTKKKKEPARYEIDSFEKLVNVTNMKNFNSIAKDLVSWLGYTAWMNDNIRQTTPKKYTKDKTNWDLCKCTFIWIDDGHDGMKSIVIKNSLTGEVKNYDIKNI